MQTRLRPNTPKMRLHKHPPWSSCPNFYKNQREELIGNVAMQSCANDLLSRWYSRNDLTETWVCKEPNAGKPRLQILNLSILMRETTMYLFYMSQMKTVENRYAARWCKKQELRPITKTRWKQMKTDTEPDDIKNRNWDQSQNRPNNSQTKQIQPKERKPIFTRASQKNQTWPNRKKN